MFALKRQSCVCFDSKTGRSNMQKDGVNYRCNCRKIHFISSILCHIIIVFVFVVVSDESNSSDEKISENFICKTIITKFEMADAIVWPEWKEKRKYVNISEFILILTSFHLLNFIGEFFFCCCCCNFIFHIYALLFISYWNFSDTLNGN